MYYAHALYFRDKIVFKLGITIGFNHASMTTIALYNYLMNKLIRLTKIEGAQWLSGRVLDSRPKGYGFEPHRRHCAVVLEQDIFILA